MHILSFKKFTIKPHSFHNKFSLYFEMDLVTQILGILLFLLIWIWWVSQDNEKLERFLEKLPGPPRKPFFGNILELRSNETILTVLHEYTRTYGGMFKLHLGPFKKTIILTDYQFLQFLLNSPKILDKADSYKFIKPWLGNGLLVSTGNYWKRHRKVITPAFHFQILEQFLSVFETHGEIFLDKLRQQTGKEVEIYSLLHLLTLDIICDAAMGSSANTQLNQDSEYLRSVKDMTRIVMDRTFSLIQRNNFLFRFTKNYQVQKEALRILKDFPASFIEKKRKVLESKIENTTDEKGVRKKKPFLDLLLQTSSFTNNEIREEVDNIMFGGHDTTGTTLGFACYLLAHHPEVQQRAFEEQLSIFNDDKNGPVTYENLQEMKYLEAVIKETLRLYPTVPMFGRYVQEDVEYGDQIIPKGSNLIVFIYGVHRNPKFYPEPEKFNPDRFLEHIDKSHPYAYIPFSAGPRNCIGQKFAMLVVKTILSKLIRNVELLPTNHPLELSVGVVLKTRSGIKVILKTRDGI